MAFFADGISFIAASSGTGSFVYASSRNSFLTPAQGVTEGELLDGATYSYLAQDSLANPQQREWGYTTFTSSTSTFTRSPRGGVSSGTPTGTSPVNFTVVPVVSLTALAEDFRQVTTVNTNYYVDTTGSDSNPGTIGSPFATIGYAIHVVCDLIYIENCTIQIVVNDGTYNEFVTLRDYEGTGQDAGVSLLPAGPTGPTIKPTGSGSSNQNAVLLSLSSKLWSVGTVAGPNFTLDNTSASNCVTCAKNTGGGPVLFSLNYTANNGIGRAIEAGNDSFVFLLGTSQVTGVFGVIVGPYGECTVYDQTTWVFNSVTAIWFTWLFNSTVKIDGMSFSGSFTGLKFYIDGGKIGSTEQGYVSMTALPGSGGTFASGGSAVFGTDAFVKKSGAPVNATDLIAGASGIFKDTGQSTGLGIALYADDAGTLVPLAKSNTGVTAGSYTNTALTVDAQGHITAASDAGGLSVTITTAQITGPGSTGSMTFTNGILTAQTPAT